MGPKRTLQTSSSVGQAAAPVALLPHAIAEMATLEARLATFNTKASPKWPHPHNPRKKEHVPSPAELAALGFFYAPDPAGARKKNDRLQHYLCATMVSSWQPGDDPLVRLRAANPACPTVVLADSAKAQLDVDAWRHQAESTGSPPPARWNDPLLFPHSEHMLAVRLATFQAISWPHDPPHVRGWKPTSARLAEAGFNAAHTEEGDDTAACMYCGRTLSGWEKADDPRAEHLRGERPCPFFAAELVDRRAGRDIEEHDESMPLASSDTDDTAQLRRAKANRRQALPDDDDDDDCDDRDDGNRDDGNRDDDDDDGDGDDDDDDDEGSQGQELTQKPRMKSSKTTRSMSDTSRASKNARAKEVGEIGSDEDGNVEDGIDEDENRPSRPAHAAKATPEAKTAVADAAKAQPQARVGQTDQPPKQVAAIEANSDEEMEQVSEAETSEPKPGRAAHAEEPDHELDSQELVSQELALGKRRAPGTRSTSRTTRSASRAASRTASKRQTSASRRANVASTAAVPDPTPAALAVSGKETGEDEGQETEENLPIRRRFVPTKPEVAQAGSARSTRSATSGRAVQTKPASKSKAAAPVIGSPLEEDRLGRASNNIAPVDAAGERNAKLQSVLATYPEDIRSRTERAIEQGMTVHDFLSAEAERALARHADEGKRQVAMLEQQAAKYRVAYERTLRGLE